MSPVSIVPGPQTTLATALAVEILSMVDKQHVSAQSISPSSRQARLHFPFWRAYHCWRTSISLSLSLCLEISVTLCRLSMQIDQSQDNGPLLHGHRSAYSCARCVWVMPGDIWLSGQISQSFCLSISSWYAANQAYISICIYNAIFRCYRCCFFALLTASIWLSEETRHAQLQLSIDCHWQITAGSAAAAGRSRSWGWG